MGSGGLTAEGALVASDSDDCKPAGMPSDDDSASAAACSNCSLVADDMQSVLAGHHCNGDPLADYVTCSFDPHVVENHSGANGCGEESVTLHRHGDIRDRSVEMQEKSSPEGEEHAETEPFQSLAANGRFGFVHSGTAQKGRIEGCGRVLELPGGDMLEADDDAEESRMACVWDNKVDTGRNSRDGFHALNGDGLSVGRSSSPLNGKLVDYSQQKQQDCSQLLQQPQKQGQNQNQLQQQQQQQQQSPADKRNLQHLLQCQLKMPSLRGEGTVLGSGTDANLSQNKNGSCEAWDHIAQKTSQSRNGLNHVCSTASLKSHSPTSSSSGSLLPLAQRVLQQDQTKEAKRLGFSAQLQRELIAHGWTGSRVPSGRFSAQLSTRMPCSDGTVESRIQEMGHEMAGRRRSLGDYEAMLRQQMKENVASACSVDAKLREFDATLLTIANWSSRKGLLSFFVDSLASPPSVSAAASIATAGHAAAPVDSRVIAATSEQAPTANCLASTSDAKAKAATAGVACQRPKLLTIGLAPATSLPSPQPGLVPETLESKLSVGISLRHGPTAAAVDGLPLPSKLLAGNREDGKRGTAQKPKKKSRETLILKQKGAGQDEGPKATREENQTGRLLPSWASPPAGKGRRLPNWKLGLRGEQFGEEEDEGDEGFRAIVRNGLGSEEGWRQTRREEEIEKKEKGTAPGKVKRMKRRPLDLDRVRPDGHVAAQTSGRTGHGQVEVGENAVKQEAGKVESGSATCGGEIIASNLRFSALGEEKPPEMNASADSNLVPEGMPVAEREQEAVLGKVNLGIDSLENIQILAATTKEMLKDSIKTIEVGKEQTLEAQASKAVESTAETKKSLKELLQLGGANGAKNLKMWKKQKYLQLKRERLDDVGDDVGVVHGGEKKEDGGNEERMEKVVKCRDSGAMGMNFADIPVIKEGEAMPKLERKKRKLVSVNSVGGKKKRGRKLVKLRLKEKKQRRITKRGKIKVVDAGIIGEMEGASVQRRQKKQKGDEPVNDAALGNREKVVGLVQRRTKATAAAINWWESPKEPSVAVLPGDERREAESVPRNAGSDVGSGADTVISTKHAECATKETAPGGPAQTAFADGEHLLPVSNSASSAAAGVAGAAAAAAAESHEAKGSCSSKAGGSLSTSACSLLFEFEVGDVVWARSGVRNEPFWPAVVVDPVYGAPDGVRAQALPDALCVMFFGPSISRSRERDYAWVKQGAILAFMENFAKMEVQNLSKGRPRDFRVAVEEAVLVEAGLEADAAAEVRGDKRRKQSGMQAQRRKAKQLDEQLAKEGAAECRIDAKAAEVMEDQGKVSLAKESPDVKNSFSIAGEGCCKGCGAVLERKRRVAGVASEKKNRGKLRMADDKDKERTAGAAARGGEKAEGVAGGATVGGTSASEGAGGMINGDGKRKRKSNSKYKDDPEMTWAKAKEHAEQKAAAETVQQQQQQQQLCRACETLYESQQYCPLCGRVWLPNEKGEWVQCDGCQMWVHADCDGINNWQLQELAKGVSYFCPSCRHRHRRRSSLGSEGGTNSKKDPTTVTISKSLVVPKQITIICNVTKGLYFPHLHRIRCLCSTCRREQKENGGRAADMSVTEFERHGGSLRKRWRESIFMVEGQLSLFDWLSSLRVAGAKNLAYSVASCSSSTLAASAGNQHGSMNELQLAQLLQVPFEPVEVPWTSERCSVCNSDEDYDTNKMVICNSCEVAVHEECYGIHPSDKSSNWRCTSCSSSPDLHHSFRRHHHHYLPPVPVSISAWSHTAVNGSSRSCCLCPVKGGALKPTTIRGQWAHLACAVWMPETSVVGERMEPVEGVLKVDRDRFSLSCSICHQPHGACIQCDGQRCLVAYHVMCAMQAGYCMEIKATETDGELLKYTYCPKHRPPTGPSLIDAAVKSAALRFTQKGGKLRGRGWESLLEKGKSIFKETESDPAKVPPKASERKGDQKLEQQRGSGARGDSSLDGDGQSTEEGALMREKEEEEGKGRSAGRHWSRQRNEGVAKSGRSPGAGESADEMRQGDSTNEDNDERSREEATEGGSAARCLGFERKQHDGQKPICPRPVVPHAVGGVTQHSAELLLLLQPPLEPQPHQVESLAHRVDFVRRTAWRRVTFGHSAIHGWGLIARRPIRQGEMVIDYRGEAVRRSVADVREQQYNARGKHCYLFTVGEDLVIDATMAGNIARMLNHSCSPNCFAKILDIEGGASVIIIIARTDISVGEELTYDYRFTPEDKDRVECFCGAPNCRKYMN